MIESKRTTWSAFRKITRDTIWRKTGEEETAGNERAMAIIQFSKYKPRFSFIFGNAGFCA